MIPLIQKFVRGLEEAPIAARRRFAISVSFVITGLIFFWWLSTLSVLFAPSGTTPTLQSNVEENRAPLSTEMFRERLNDLSGIFSDAGNSNATSTTIENNPVLPAGPLPFVNNKFKYSVVIPENIADKDALSVEIARKEPNLLSRILFAEVENETKHYGISVFKNSDKRPLTLWVKEERKDRYGDGVLIEEGTVCGLPAKIYTDIEKKKQDVYFLRVVESELLVYAIEWLRYESENEQALADFEAFRKGFVCR